MSRVATECRVPLSKRNTPRKENHTVDTLEQSINTGDCFTQGSLYQLLREDGRVFIFVHKILAGAGKGSFMAHLTHLLGRHKDEYVDTGKSRDEALRDCLARIKEVTTKDRADVQSR
jgi:hypothetical protein